MEFDKKKAVEILLDKKFGIKNPDEIDNLLEVNIFEAVDGENTPLGIGIELVIQKDENTIKEEYQVSQEGIVYSWGNAPVVDKRSKEHSIDIER
jgi:hypothetical protein